MTHSPDKWLIVKTNEFNKVFAVWGGGYLDGDFWRCSSVINNVTEEENYFLFHCESGSTYRCNKNNYGTSGFGSSVLSKVPDKLEVLKDPNEYIEAMKTKHKTNDKVDSPDEVGLSPTTCSAGAIPWDFTPEEKEEVINHIRSLGPQYQNSTVILDKSDIPEDLLDQVSFADRDEDEVRNASRQFLSNLRRHREIQNQNPQDHSKSSNSDSEI